MISVDSKGRKVKVRAGPGEIHNSTKREIHMSALIPSGTLSLSTPVKPVTGRPRSLFAVCFLGFVLITLGMALPNACAQQGHSLAAEKIVRGPSGIAVAHVGDTVVVQINVYNFDFFGDAHLVTNVSDRVFHTSGTTDTGNLLPGLGGSFTLTNLSDFKMIPSAHTYVVQPDDPDNLIDEIYVVSTDLGNGLRFSVNSQAALKVLRPCIAVMNASSNTSNGMISFSGSVSNCGNTTLTNVFVFNNQPSNNTPVIGPITLLTNQTASFSGSYQPTNPCLLTMDTAAFGTDGLGLTVSNSVSATSAFRLSVISSGTHLVVSWPSAIPCLTFQEATNPAISNSWVTTVRTLITNNDQISVSIPMTNFSRFFRLKSQ